MSRKQMPHNEVYVRLAPSTVHGIGVFAIRDIPKGTLVCKSHEGALRWIQEKEVEELPPEMQKLYEDFCIYKDGQYGCPRSFNDLTPSWYINHSETPNVDIDEDAEFFALKLIKAGEELLADYSSYNDE